MKKVFTFVVLSTILVVSFSFISCNKEDEDGKTYYRYGVYRAKLQSKYERNSTVPFLCSYIDCIEFNASYFMKYRIHSSSCLTNHLLYQTDKYGTSEDWNYFGKESNDWKYKRDDLKKIKIEKFETSHIKLDNGEEYDLESEEINDSTYIVRLISTTDLTVYYGWKTGEDIAIE